MARRWFNNVSNQVLPYTVYDKEHLYDLSNKLEEEFMTTESVQLAKQRVEEAFDEILPIIKTASRPQQFSSQESVTPSQSCIPNTALIFMWDGQSSPLFNEVSVAIEESFTRFGIHTSHVEDIERRTYITSTILKHLAESEFLISDLTGQGAGIYYGLGFAAALNKRPILFRLRGTRVAFDTFVHAVTEYRDVEHLRKILDRRLQSIFGRKAGRITEEEKAL
jgi:hypothetical protein